MPVAVERADGYHYARPPSLGCSCNSGARSPRPSRGRAAAGAPRCWRSSGRPAGGQRATVDFQKQIQPILEARCLECHSRTSARAGCRSRPTGTSSKAARTAPSCGPGNAGSSLLIHRVTGGETSRRCRRTSCRSAAAEIALLARWIDQGARADAERGRRAGAVGSAAGARRARRCRRLAGPAGRRRSIASSPHISGGRHGTAGGGRRRAVRPPRLPRHLGPAADARAAPGIRRRSRRRTSAPRSSRTLLADDDKYAEHWISFWNDLLRNEDGVTYFSESAGRKSITRVAADRRSATNLPYDRFVDEADQPDVAPADPEGFLVGVNWRGETSAAVTPWMQASQNTAQVFLGVNLKCTSCHDSFVSKWKLKDAYGLAAYFSPEPTLQMYRCDIAAGRHDRPGLPLPRAGARRRARTSLADRRAAAARDLHRSAHGPAAAHDRQPRLAAAARPAASSPTPTRWTASRGVRRSSTGWPATSSRTATT